MSPTLTAFHRMLTFLVVESLTLNLIHHSFRACVARSSSQVFKRLTSSYTSRRRAQRIQRGSGWWPGSNSIKCSVRLKMRQTGTSRKVVGFLTVVSYRAIRPCQSG